MTEVSGLTPVTRSGINAAAETLTRAFRDYPIPRYFYPDEAVRERKMPYSHRFMLRYGIRYGEVYATSPRMEGVAMWLLWDKADMTLWRLLRSGALFGAFRLLGEGARRAQQFGQEMTKVHRRLVPYRHWYLQVIGVDPAFQGKGYGGMLLKPVLKRLDAQGLPCYLETELEKNVALYQHFGFSVLEQFEVPGTGFQNWAMLRPASGSG